MRIVKLYKVVEEDIILTTDKDYIQTHSVDMLPVQMSDEWAKPCNRSVEVHNIPVRRICNSQWSEDKYVAYDNTFKNSFEYSIDIYEEGVRKGKRDVDNARAVYKNQLEVSYKLDKELSNIRRKSLIELIVWWFKND